jgi:hypothetical protein
MGWCDDYLSGLDGADWWKMRCAILHLGSSIPQQKGARRSKYTSFSFVDPDHFPERWHKHHTVDSRGLNITLDIAQLADEMVGAVRTWFDDVTSRPDLTACVTQNLPNLVRMQPKSVADIEIVDTGGSVPTVTIVEHRSITTGST